MFENVLEVLDHQFNGRVHIVPTISAEEASSKVDADNAAGFTDCSQLTVDEISRMRAQGMRIGVRGDEGRIADSGNVPETAFVKVRKINQNPQTVAGAYQLLAEVRQSQSLALTRSHLFYGANSNALGRTTSHGPLCLENDCQQLRRNMS